MPPRPILFDMDGVLVHGWHTNPAKRRRWDATLKKDMGIEPEDMQTFFSTLFEPKVLPGQMGFEEALAIYLPQIGYHGSPKEVIRYWLEHDAVINRPLWELIEKLRASGRVRLYIASNQEHVRSKYLWETVGFKKIFDDFFYAASFKTLKPDLAYYRACEARMDPACAGQQPLFFDDYHVCVEGARRAGWEAHIYEDEETCLSHPFIREILR